MGAYSRSTTVPDPRLTRRRAASWALTIAAHVLLFLLLMKLAPPFSKPPERDPLETFTVAPGPADTARAKTSRAQKAAKAAAPAKALPQDAPDPRPTSVPPPLPPVPSEFPALRLSREDMDRADLARMPNRGGGQLADAGEGQGEEEEGDAGVGRGPNGEPLYNAEWFREPTSAELNGYLNKPPPPDSWALIACRTISNYGVEDCRQLGESPQGSGLARAMRQAAWQFKVRPPRRGGKVLVGAWVRIRISFHRVSAGE
jgi:hypothetical protein